MGDELLFFWGEGIDSEGAKTKEVPSELLLGDLVPTSL